MNSVGLCYTSVLVLSGLLSTAAFFGLVAGWGCLWTSLLLLFTHYLVSLCKVSVLLAEVCLCVGSWAEKSCQNLPDICQGNTWQSWSLDYSYFLLWFLLMFHFLLILGSFVCQGSPPLITTYLKKSCQARASIFPAKNSLWLFGLQKGHLQPRLLGVWWCWDSWLVTIPWHPEAVRCYRALPCPVALLLLPFARRQQFWWREILSRPDLCPSPASQPIHNCWVEM